MSGSANSNDVWLWHYKVSWSLMALNRATMEREAWGILLPNKWFGPWPGSSAYAYINWSRWRWRKRMCGNSLLWCTGNDIDTMLNLMPKVLIGFVWAVIPSLVTSSHWMSSLCLVHPKWVFMFACQPYSLIERHNIWFLFIASDSNGVYPTLAQMFMFRVLRQSAIATEQFAKLDKILIVKQLSYWIRSQKKVLWMFCEPLRAQPIDAYVMYYSLSGLI